LDVLGIDRNLVVGPHQVDLGEDTTTRDLMGIVMDMPDRVGVRYSPGVEGSVVTAGSPTVIFLRD
jgi:hypothetical protein